MKPGSRGPNLDVCVGKACTGMYNQGKNEDSYDRNY
jgi:hypothetical protein